MTDERYNYLNEAGGSLTSEELDEGWHFCADFDDALIHRDWPEADCCHCFEYDPVG